VSSEYETYYGVMHIQRGLYQEYRDMASLLSLAKKRWASVESLTAWDGTTTWFDTIPWAPIPEEATDEEVDRVQERRRELETALSDGGWIEVDPDLLDEENGSAVRTTADEVHLDERGFFLTFYEKHGDHRYVSDVVLLKDLAAHFGDV
jgi:hypothetical protein